MSIRVLLKSWEAKTITLKELNDEEEMNLTGFMCNVKIHEIEMKARDECEPQKKINVAFKTSQENAGRKVLSHQLSQRKQKMRKMKISQSL